jgi:hypothetical protein
MGAVSELRAEVDATDALTEHIRSVTDRLVAREVERGAKMYVRETHLPPLLGRSWEIMSDVEIVARLQRKIFAESKRLQAGHWSADSNRLIAMRAAIEGEKLRCGRAGPGSAGHG